MNTPTRALHSMAYPCGHLLAQLQRRRRDTLQPPSHLRQPLVHRVHYVHLPGRHPQLALSSSAPHMRPEGRKWRGGRTDTSGGYHRRIPSAPPSAVRAPPQQASPCSAPRIRPTPSQERLDEQAPHRAQLQPAQPQLAARRSPPGALEGQQGLPGGGPIAWGRGRRGKGQRAAESAEHLVALAMILLGVGLIQVRQAR